MQITWLFEWKWSFFWWIVGGQGRLSSFCLSFVHSRRLFRDEKKTTTLFCFAICISLHFSSVQRDNKYGVCVCIFLLLILHFATTITMSFFESPCGIWAHRSDMSCLRSSTESEEGKAKLGALNWKGNGLKLSLVLDSERTFTTTS